MKEHSNVESKEGGEIINSDHKHVLRSLGSGTKCTTAHTVRSMFRGQSAVVDVGAAGIRHAVAVAVAVAAAEVGKFRTVDSGR